MSGGERARKRQRQPGDQPNCSRLQRKRRQGVVEIGLLERGDAQFGSDSVGSQPTKTELIANRQQNQGGSGTSNIGESQRKLDSCVQGLTGLNTRRKVGASNNKQTTRRAVLPIRHISIVAPAISEHQQRDGHLVVPHAA